jgi:hypothetical protein
VTIELTEQQRQALQGNGDCVEVVDPASRRAYVLLTREEYDRLRSTSPKGPAEPERPFPEIPIGIRLSQEAFRRDLPELLKDRRLREMYVAYHRNERIGFARDMATLIQECLKRGLDDDEFDIGMIRESSLVEVEEID